MKLRLLLLTLVGIGLALFYGWFVDSRREQTTVSPLQVPDNIDYYLAEVDYLALSRDGTPHLHLQTPYLEHFIREDISQLTTPRLRYHAGPVEWRLQARQGTLIHGSETFEMIDEAKLERVDTGNPLQLSSDKLVFHSSEELLVAPGRVRITARGVVLNAANAAFDLANQRHRFDDVKATYRPVGQPPGAPHAPG